MLLSVNGTAQSYGVIPQHWRRRPSPTHRSVATIAGVVGVLAGAAATAVYANAKNWAVVIPIEAWAGGIASALLIGAFAGLMPAIRASRMPPTAALRTV
jgi:putative ABC transport system permease protein